MVWAREHALSPLYLSSVYSITIFQRHILVCIHAHPISYILYPISYILFFLSLSLSFLRHPPSFFIPSISFIRAHKYHLSEIVEQEYPTRKSRLEESWQYYIAADGQSVALHPLLANMLNNNEFAPEPRVNFQALRNDLNAGDEIVIPNLGQVPKHFGQYFHKRRVLVTEQMLSIWQEIAADRERSLKESCPGLWVVRACGCWQVLPRLLPRR